MKASIQDRSVLSSVSLQDILDYLNATSWQQIEGPSTFGKVFYRPDNPSASEILAPSAEILDDYPTRVSQAIRALSLFENRSETAILADINNVSIDVIRLRVPEVSSGRHSTWLHSGIHLLEHAMEMMVAAASAAVSPRKVIPSRKPPQVDAYIKWIELGPSEKGSYVVTILSRVQPMLVPSIPSILEVIDTPFPRVVTRSLAKALSATKNAISSPSSNNPIESFLAAVPLGVSANLCEALSQLPKSYDRLTELNIDIHWALKVPESESISSFNFLEIDSELLSSVARKFRESEPTEDQVITGVVINLHREEPAPEGIVTISCVVNNKLIKLHVTLSHDDYEKAIEAHKIHKGVIFRADIVQTGKKFVAQNVIDFRIVN